MTASHIPPPTLQKANDEQRWSARRTLAFILVSSFALWALIILALRALF